MAAENMAAALLREAQSACPDGEIDVCDAAGVNAFLQAARDRGPVVAPQLVLSIFTTMASSPTAKRSGTRGGA